QDVVEVRIPATAGEAVRRFPWEFVLAEISRKARKDRKRLLVVRQLVGAPNRPPSPAPAIAGERQVAIVRSEPGKLAGEFSFDSEENLVIFSFAGEGTGSGDARTAPAPKLLPAKIKQLKDPTLSGIRDEVGSFGYDV